MAQGIGTDDLALRDTIAFGGAVLIEMAPLIYTVGNELIKTFLLAPLTL